MVRGVTDGPPIPLNYGAMGGGKDMAPAKSNAPVTVPQMNGILDELGLGTLGGKVEKFVMKGTGEDAPRQDGPVRSRSEAVKNFFSGVSDTLGSLFSKIGKGFQTAFEGIKGAVTSAVADIKQAFAKPTEDKGNLAAQELQDRKGVALKEFGETISKELEYKFQDYTQKTDDTPPKTREEFVRTLMPPPEGGVDQTAKGYFGDMIGFLGSTMGPTKDEGVTAMRQALMGLFTEAPSLDIAHGFLFQDECKKLDSAPATFLRSNNALSKLDKFMGLASIPMTSISNSVLASQKEEIAAFGHLGSVEGINMSMKGLSQEQAEAMHEVADNILTTLLDVDPNRSDSLANSVDQGYLSLLSSQAEKIVANDSLSSQEKKSAMNMMYANSLFLRVMSPELVKSSIQTYGGTENQTFMVQTMQFLQTFLNGATNGFSDKGNQIAVDTMNQVSQTHQPRLEAFFQTLGMPVINDQQIN